MAHFSLFIVELIAVGKYCFWHLCQPQDINSGVTSISFSHIFFSLTFLQGTAISGIFHLPLWTWRQRICLTFQQCLLLLTVNGPCLFFLDHSLSCQCFTLYVLETALILSDPPSNLSPPLFILSFGFHLLNSFLDSVCL